MSNGDYLRLAFGFGAINIIIDLHGHEVKQYDKI